MSEGRGESVWGKALQTQEAASRMTLRQKQGGFVTRTPSRPVRRDQGAGAE